MSQPPQSYQSYQPNSPIHNVYQSSPPMPTSAVNKRFDELFANENVNEKDYNHTTVKTAVVNRGDTHAPRVVNVEVEEDYPDRVKLANAHDNHPHTISAYRSQNNFSIPEASMEDSTSERVRHSFQNNLSNLSNTHSRSPNSHINNAPLLQENSNIPAPRTNTFNNSRLPPRVDSAISDGSEKGEYKMSFMNTGKSIKEQMRAMGANQA